MANKKPAGSPPNISILDSVRNWINDTGYPLEFEVADIFSKAGFLITQSYYVTDNETDKPREVDVLASFSLESAKACFVIECKYSVDRPWVVFSSLENKLSTARYICATIATEEGSLIIPSLSANPKVQELDIFKTFERSGYLVKQAWPEPGQRDIPYEAVQTLCSNSANLSAQASRFSRVLFFPTLVIDGKLFECYYDKDRMTVEILQKDHMRIHWRASNRSYLINVDIVTKQFLASYASLRMHDLRVLLHEVSEIPRPVLED